MKSKWIVLIAIMCQQISLTSQLDYSYQNGLYLDDDILLRGPHHTESAEELPVRKALEVQDHGYHVEEVNYTVNLPYDSTVEVKLYNSYGDQVKTLEAARSVKRGEYAFSSNLEGFESGNYILVVNSFPLSKAITITLE